MPGKQQPMHQRSGQQQQQQQQPQCWRKEDERRRQYYQKHLSLGKSSPTKQQQQQHKQSYDQQKNMESQKIGATKRQQTYKLETHQQQKQQQPHVPYYFEKEQQQKQQYRWSTLTRKQLANEREDIQKKTFAKWINSQLSKGGHPPVTDLFYDLRDGTRLLALLEVLTSQTYKREKGRMRVHHLNNVSRALAVLDNHSVKLVNISNEHIVDGSPKLTLGLVWAIILHWQVQGVLKDVMSDLQQTNLEKTLLAWCRQTTKGYEGVDVGNFTTSWSDGLALNALLHAHRPTLFDWGVLARRLPYARLDHAFKLAQQHLGIERLLDPEDVNSQVPDKKSIMMYVMCLFQALPHDGSFSLDTSMQSESSLSVEGESMEAAGGLSPTASSTPTKGRPLSTASIGLSVYQRTLEEVLSWLLGAEDRLAAMPPIAPSTDLVKDQFHELEELMLDLTSKQGGIGEVLGEGGRLLREGVMEEEEEEEVRMQMKLLNTRWEELRVKAMDRQARLHEKLMSLQQQQLESLKKWLTDTEDRIANMSQVGPTTAALKEQIETHQKLQKDLEGEQANINSLSNMVVVVDEASPESAYSTLEDELNALGERWAHICRWAESRWVTLQNLSIHWCHYERELGEVRVWLDNKEAQLRQYESDPSTDQQHILRHASALQVLQAEMEVLQKRFEHLQEGSGKVLGHLPQDSPAQETIAAEIETVQDRIDCLISIMEAQTQRLVASGIDISKVSMPVEGVEGGDDKSGVVSSSTTTITTQEGATVITKIVTTKVTEQMSGSVVKRQKLEGGSREDFNVALHQLGGWMEEAEQRVKATPPEDLTTTQLEELSRQLESEMENQKEEYLKVVSLGQSAISETATIGESAQESQREVAAVTARWEALTEMIITIRTRITYLVERETVTTQLTTHQTRYSDLLKWYEDDVSSVKDGMADDVTKQLEESMTKLEDLKQQKDQLVEVRRRTEELDGRWEAERQEVLQQVLKLLACLEELILKLEEHISILGEKQTHTTSVVTLDAAPLQQAAQPTVPEPFQALQSPFETLLKAMEASREWLKSLNAALRSEQARGTLIQLQDRLAKFKDLSEKVETERGNITHINGMCEELAKAGHVDLLKDSAKLNEQWDATTQALQDRIAEIEKAIEQQKQYNEEVSGLKSWLAEVDIFLKAEEAALGDVETLEAQLEQSNALQDDIATLQTNVDNIRSTGKNLVEAGGMEVQEQQDQLMSRWALVTRMAKEQNKSLRDALARSQKVQSDVEKLSVWLDDLEGRIPSTRPTETPEQLTTALDLYTQLRDDISAHCDDLTALNNIGDEMLQREQPPSDLARVFTQLNGRWSTAMAQVDTRHKTLLDASQNFLEFQKLCEEESEWLDQLEGKLQRPPKEAADAEEISETLDELELFLHSHDQSRLDRMTALGEALEQDGCMAGWVRDTTATLTQRFHTLNIQASERQCGLEGSVKEAQAWEREYVGVLDFLSQCDVTLSQALTEQTNINLAKIQEEMLVQTAVLEKMEGQVKVYGDQGKTEAATRLNNQVTHLRKKYEEVEVRLRACQQPSEYEQRLATMEQQLASIADRVNTANLTPLSSEPAHLQQQLDQCMEVYQTLSQVKGEVEEVIAMGRKVVKEGQCSNPDTLTSRLDQLKALYNQLGGAVTERRGSLETTLRNAARAQRDVTQLGDWLATTERDLDQREATIPIRSVQDELNYAQHALEELARRKPLLTGLRETLAALTTTFPSPHQSSAPHNSLMEAVGDVELTWERVNTRLTNRLKNMQTEQAGKEREMEEFIMGLGEVKGWLESTETQLATLSALKPDQRDAVVKSVRQEVETYKDRISGIRDTASDLVSHGVLFQARVAPELELINQRWEAVYCALQKQEALEGSAAARGMVVTEETMVVSRSYVRETAHQRVHPVSSSSTVTSSSPEVAQDEVEGYLREVAKLADQITAIKNRVLVVPSYLEVNEKVESVEQEVATLEPDVATVISRGDTLTLTTHMVDVPRANNIRVAVRDLRQQWASLKTLTENLKQDCDRVEQEMGTISERVGEIVSWSDDVSKRLHLANNDESQLQALELEVTNKRFDLDRLNESGALLRRYGYTRAQPSLSLLNTRWTEINAKLRQFRKGSLEKKTLVGKTELQEPEDGQAASEFVGRVNHVREGVAAIAKQLSSHKPHGRHYVDLPAQEQHLKSIKEGLDTLKPRVDSIEGERDITVASLTPGRAEQVRKAIDNLRQEWAQVNRGYTEQQARWVGCSETWGSLHRTLADFTSWLDGMEAKIRDASSQPLSEARTTQKELEKQVTLKHRPSQTLQSSCREVTEGLGQEEAKKLQERVDAVLRRWRGLLLELAARRERIAIEEGGTAVAGREGGGGQYECLVTWVEQASALTEAAVNVTDEAALAAHSTMVQNHLHELPGKQELLKKLQETHPKTVSPAQTTALEASLEKLSDTLPRYRNMVETKLGVIQTLVREVEEMYRWTEEVRIRQALRGSYTLPEDRRDNHRPPMEPVEDRVALTEEHGKPWKVVLREKEAAYENLDSTFWVLAQDAETKGLTVSMALKNRMSTIESRLKSLHGSPSPPPIRSTTSPPPQTEGGVVETVSKEKEVEEEVKVEVKEEEEEEVVEAVGTTVTSSVTSVIKDVIKFEESVLSGDAMGGDLRAPSPLVCPPSHPPDSSPVLILASLDKSILQIRDWLTLMEQMTRQQTVVVGDADDIRQLTEKQKNVLRELEGKKPQLDDLVASADSLKDDASRTQLHQKVSKLREHWDETNSVVLARKTQLDAMYSDTHKFEAKRVELEAWLARMEARLERMAPVARTADVLDQQIREQKGFHAEIHQYKHQVELFNQMTQRLIAIYQHDDTRRLKKVTEAINLRYSTLNSSIVGRGKELHGAMNSLHSFDKALEKFLSWLSEAESGGDLLEGEVDKLPPRHPLPRAPQAHLKDLQSEIESHKDVLASLNATGQKLLGTLDNQEEAVMLQRRLHEMNQRWNTLKHKSIAIRNRLEGNSENWNSLLLSLRELIEWVIRKDTELTALGPAVGDLSSLAKYSEDLAAFRRVIDEKQPVIESNLKSGRQLVASEPPLSDTSDSEAGRDLDGDLRYRGGDEAAREVTRSVRREVSKLSDKWAALRDRAASQAAQADLAHKKLGVLQKTVEDVSSRMEEAERSVEAWGPVPQDPNLADQHAHNVRKLRENLADLQRGVDDVNDQAARFSAHNVPLTPANSARLHDLNNRWKILESCVNERWRSVAGRSREVTPVTPAQLASSVSPPWERATTPSKVPYYINHEQESTHWDHPAMMELLDSLTEFNHIKFSAYRTATKLRLLQKKLALDRAKMQTATDIFDEHGLRGQNDRLIDVSDMLVVLSALYATIGDEHSDVDTTLAMDLCLNWLLNVYDSQRTGQMRVLSFKIGLVCLCTGHLEEKYRYMFRLIADPNRLADQRKLGLLLHDCVQVPRQLGEVAAFGGSNIEPSVRSCFTKAGKDRETIEAVHFLAWVQQEPQSLVWLAVLHRVAASETIQHQVKCNICKAYPIIGLRYRCLKCLSFDMCQRCFFDGRSGKSHKITHPMHEYCTATTTGEDMKDFTKALKNKFKSKRSLQKHTKKGYLPVQTVLEGDPLESPSPSPQHNVTSQDMHSRLELYASRLAEVELRTNSNSTPDSEDEHGLIAQYCQSLSSSDAPLPVPRSPLQVMAAVDAEQKDELEQMIRALEEENSVLQAEYDRLKSQQPVGSPPEDGPGGGGGGQRSEAEMIAEAKLLRQHKGRLEARMGILEEHNRQLEAQLHRLRQLLGEPGGMSSPNKSGTLQTKAVTASQLAMDSPAKINGHSTQGELGKAVGTLVATMTHEPERDWPSKEEGQHKRRRKGEGEEEEEEDSDEEEEEEEKKHGSSLRGHHQEKKSE